VSALEPPPRARVVARVVGVIALLVAACSRQPPANRAASPSVSSPENLRQRVQVRRDAVQGTVAALPPWRMPAPARLVAVGDIHGDQTAARNVLRLAGAIDAQDHWSGGALVVVQTGDVLDRGDDERELLDWFQRLRDEATRAGGAFVMLNGNHEIMNVEADFRYVTPGGYDDFREFVSLANGSPAAARLPPEVVARTAAFAPGGPYARRLAELNTVVVVGDTVFVHGGLRESDVRYGFERMNTEVRAWMLGDSPDPPAMVRDDDGPVWSRVYALRSDPETCNELGRVLAAASLRRLVIGHTVQSNGMNSACDGRVWRIDVGLARYYRGPTQALEVVGANARILGDDAR